MTPRLNHVMALARASLHHNPAKGEIRAALEQADADRAKTLQRLIEEKRMEESGEAADAAEKAKVDAFMAQAAERVEQQRAEAAAMVEEQMEAQPVEQDLLNALGTSSTTTEMHS